jgi:hypothetical protein
MANKFQGEVDVRLDRVRTLLYDFNAFAEFEDATGKTVQQAFKDAQQTFGYSQMRRLLWAGLLHEDPALTIPDAGKLVHYADGDTEQQRFENVAKKVFDAIMRTHGDPDKKKDGRSKAVTKMAGTGE